MSFSLLTATATTTTSIIICPTDIPPTILDPRIFGLLRMAVELSRMKLKQELFKSLLLWRLASSKTSLIFSKDNVATHLCSHSFCRDGSMYWAESPRRLRTFSSRTLLSNNPVYMNLKKADTTEEDSGIRMILESFSFQGPWNNVLK